MKGVDIRPCGPAESQSWAEFLDRNFGYVAPESYRVDFAPLFSAAALSRSRLVYHDGSIVASATLYPVTAMTPSRRIDLGIIGAVATDERFRGRGLSSQVLRELEAQARQSRLSGLILWSDQKEFYAKFGFVEAGRQRIYSLARLPRPAQMLGGSPEYGWDWAQVRALYDKHPLRVERTAAHWAELKEITSCTRVQWRGADGKVRAYIGFDRGHDLKNIVHEWGGEREALHLLVWTVLQSRPNLLWLTHPALAEDPISNALGPALVSGTLGLFKPLDGSVSAGHLKDAWFWGLDSL